LRRWRRALLILLGVVLLAGAGITARLIHRSLQPYHFLEVDPGKLYRSGQVETWALEKMHGWTGFRTIIDLCGEKRDCPLVQEERAFARENKIRYENFIQPHGMEDREEAREHVESFLEILDDPGNFPVLLHCWNGVKRTGILVAIYKIEYLGVDNEQAIRELPTFGRTLEDFHDSEIEFIRNYVPRWKRSPLESGPKEPPGGKAARRGTVPVFSPVTPLSR